MRELELIQGTTQAFTLDLEQEGAITQVTVKVFKVTGQTKVTVSEHVWPHEAEKEPVIQDGDNYVFVLTPELTEAMLGSYAVEVTYVSDRIPYRMQAGEIVILKKSEQ